jgi:hypothetical protein
MFGDSYAGFHIFDDATEMFHVGFTVVPEL